MAKIILLGEAPPPVKFFYYGDSLFFQYTRRAFARALSEVDRREEGWFLALFRELGGWRRDVCETPRRPHKGGADDVSDCIEGFLARWNALRRDPEALVVVSPKRLEASLPEAVQAAVTAALPPPGQWNAHRRAFLDGLEDLLVRCVGQEALQAAARRVDADDARLDFEIARACAGAEPATIARLLRGHPRAAVLARAWEQATERGG